MSDAPDPHPTPHPPNESWMAAASNFVRARIELVKLEARDAGAQATRKIGLLFIIAGCAFFFWLAGNAGLIGLIAAAKPEWPWYAVTLAVALLHLLAGMAAVMVLKKASPPPFPLTRKELSKDQAWLETLKKDPTSRN